MLQTCHLVREGVLFVSKRQLDVLAKATGVVVSFGGSIAEGLEKTVRMKKIVFGSKRRNWNCFQVSLITLTHTL